MIRIRQLLVGLAAVVLALFGGAAAPERHVPGSTAEMLASFAPVVHRVAPMVVNVYAAKINRNPFADDPFYRLFNFPGLMPRERVQRSLGSGVIVDSSGLVVTNNHVIEGADEVKVALADKREFEATLLLKDARSDLAVLRLKDGREQFPAIELGNSDELQVGDLVLAIGNPFGVGQTVTHGIVSAVARTKSASPIFSSSSRPTRRSIRAIPAARWSICADDSPASTRRFSRARAARKASALPFPSTWCAWWWHRRRAAAARSSVRGSAPSCRTSMPKSPKASDSSGRAARSSPMFRPAVPRRAPGSRPAT